jgi:hypothetical protein
MAYRSFDLSASRIARSSLLISKPIVELNIQKNGNQIQRKKGVKTWGN